MDGGELCNFTGISTSTVLKDFFQSTKCRDRFKEKADLKTLFQACGNAQCLRRSIESKSQPFLFKT